MGKVYTRFETKTAQKPYPIGRPKPNYSLYKGVPPPPPPGLFIPAIASHPVLDQKWGENEDVCRYRYRRQQRWLSFAAEFCKPAGLCVACEQQTHFRSSLLSLRKIGGREGKTGNASTVRRLGFVWNLTMFCICVMPNQLYQGIHHSAWNRCISARSRKAFSIHEEHAKYEFCNLQDAVTLLKESKETLHYLRRNEALIRGEIPSLPTFSMTYSPRKEGVNGVNRIATKGENTTDYRQNAKKITDYR